MLVLVDDVFSVVFPMFSVGNVVKHRYRSDKMNQKQQKIKTHAYNYTLLCVYEKKKYNTQEPYHTIPTHNPTVYGNKNIHKTKQLCSYFSVQNITKNMYDVGT